MGKIQSVSGPKPLFHYRPDGALSRIRHQHFDYSPPLACFLDAEKSFSGHPSVFPGTIPVPWKLLGLADNDVETIVLHVQRLPRPLNPIADYGNRLVLRTLRALLMGNSLRVTTSSFTPPKLMSAIFASSIFGSAASPAQSALFVKRNL